MSIPKIIHQTWKSSNIPDKWAEFVRSWTNFHPEWEYLLWTDQDNDHFVKEHYPEFASIYNSFSYTIQKADAIRYLILYKLGGVYVDLDMECLQSIDHILNGKTFVASYENKQHAKWVNEHFLVSNALMASVGGHPFLEAIIAKLRRNNTKAITALDVLKTTGPIMLTTVYREYPNNDITILDGYILSPFQSNSRKLNDLFNNKPNSSRFKSECMHKGVIAIHYWRNSWLKTIAGVLENPFPHTQENYIFYPGVNSKDYNITNGGRNIHDLAKKCDAMHKAVGFSTDGFIKYYIRPLSACTVIDDTAENEGIYIKKRWNARLRNCLLSIRHHYLSKLRYFILEDEH